MFSAGPVAFQFETGGRRERFERAAMSAGAGALVLVGQVLFAVFFARSAWGHYRRQPMMIGAARSAKLPLPYLAGWPSALWLGAGSLLLAVGIWPDLGALMLGAFVIPARPLLPQVLDVRRSGAAADAGGQFLSKRCTPRGIPGHVRAAPYAWFWSSVLGHLAVVQVLRQAAWGSTGLRVRLALGLRYVTPRESINPITPEGD